MVCRWFAVGSVLFLGFLVVCLVVGCIRPESQQLEGSEPTPPTTFGLGIEKWIETQGGIGGIALSPDESRLYVAYWANDTGSPIEEYSVQTGQRLQSFPFDERHCHGDVVVSKDGRFVFTTNYYFTHASRLDLAQGGCELREDVGGVRTAVWAADIVRAPDGKLIAIAVGADGRNYDMENDQISIMDISGENFELVGEVKLPDEPRDHKMGFSGDSRFAYIVTYPRQSENAALYEVSLRPPFRVTRRLEFPGGELAGIAIHDAFGKLFVSDSASKRIWVVNSGSFRIESSIDLKGSAPGTLAMSATGDVLYALATATRSLWAIDPESSRVLGLLVGLRRQPDDLEVSRDGSHVFVSHRGEDGGVCMIRKEARQAAVESLSQPVELASKPGPPAVSAAMPLETGRRSSPQARVSELGRPAPSPDLATILHERSEARIASTLAAHQATLEIEFPDLADGSNKKSLVWFMTDAIGDAAQEVFGSRFSQVLTAMRAVEVKLRVVRADRGPATDRELGQMLEQALLDFLLERILGQEPIEGRATTVADELAERFNRLAAQRVEQYTGEQLVEFMVTQEEAVRRALVAGGNNEESERAKEDLKLCFEEEFEKLAQEELDTVLSTYLEVLKDIDARLAGAGESSSVTQ